MYTLYSRYVVRYRSSQLYLEVDMSKDHGGCGRNDPTLPRGWKSWRFEQEEDGQGQSQGSVWEQKNGSCGLEILSSLRVEEEKMRK